MSGLLPNAFGRQSPPSSRPAPFAPFREEIYQTPHVSPGRTITPLGVVFHHSCGASLDGDTSWIMHSSSKVSYHCLIGADGTRRIFAQDTQRAWHAGESSWRGRRDCNSFMLGCAFSGDTYPDRRFGRLLTDAEIASALEWLAPRWKRWGFTMEMMTDHRQVSPGRKDDLNPTQWERLRAAIAGRFA